jgi:Ni2+-binding GTPase involved in maturation of urease and hydrogenase
MSSSHKLIELVRTANPYHYLGPVPSKEFFFDREEEMETAMVVLKQIMKGSVGGVLVQGGRGSGKTSFLKELQRHLSEEKIASAYIPLDPEMVKDGMETRLFSAIFQELISSAYEAGILEQNIASKFANFLRNISKIENVEVDFPGFNLIITPAAAKEQFSYIVLKDGLKDFMKLVETKGVKGARKGAVVLLDEGDALTLNEKLLHVLRNAFQEMKGIALVVAGSTKLSTQVGVVFSPVPRFFRKIELGPYPNDEVVNRAIYQPLKSCHDDLLLNNQIRLDIQHFGFDKRLKEVAGRTPIHINMLCNFAFDLGAKNLRQDQGTTFILRMIFDKELIEDAITQLRGTKNYAEFIDSLDKTEVNFLTILSRSPMKLSINEATLMIVLDELRELLQTLPIEDVCKQMNNCTDLLQSVSNAVVALADKASKYEINLLGADILKKRFDIEDQWIKAYFRYSVQNFNFDMDTSDLPFIGIHFFGNAISSVFHSIFFARLAKFMDSTDRSRAHEGPTAGDELKPFVNRKLLMVTYKPYDSPNYHHIGFNLRLETNTIKVKEEMDSVAKELRNLEFITHYSIKEPSCKVFT